MTSQASKKVDGLENLGVQRRNACRYEGDIVISGISGRYPDSPDIDELWKNLINKKDMITSNETVTRFPEGFHGIGDFGKINGAEKFDNEFFRLSPDCANWMSNETRLCLEMAYETIVDAGQSLQSIAGSNTGTFYAHGRSVDAMWAFTKGLENISPHSFMGLSHCMLANRVAHYFDLQGPSVIMDNACSSSLATLDMAVESIRNGSIDAALVGGACFIFSPGYLVESIRAGVFSVDRRCKTFDAKANGYVRGEAAGTILLQKRDDARRCYATVVQTGSGHDGNTASGFGATSYYAQNKLMKSVYHKAGVDPKDVSYIETHGTGTQVGDTNEVKAFETDGLFVKDREGPLLVGSVKSNLGHAEYVSGLVSLAKVILLMHHDTIPPNLHFETPNPKIQSIVDGRLKVVTESTPYPGGHVAINSFGIGGSLVHALLAPPETKSKTLSPAGKQARLFTYCGRCEDGLEEVLAFAKQHETIIEVQHLMFPSSNLAPSLMPFRGYAILNSPSEAKEIQKTRSKRPPVWFIFPGLGCQWMNMGQDLLTIPIARESLERTCDFFFKETGFDMMQFFTGGPKAKEIYDKIPMPLVTAIQVALVDILKAVGIEPDGIIGHSNGEVASAYADGCITGEEAVFMAYIKTGMKEFAMDLIKEEGRMAAIGLTWDECQKRIPQGVSVVCNNAEESVTVSGKAKLVEEFAQTIKSQGSLAKVLPSFGIAFHSPDMALFVDRQKELSKHILNKPKPRSNRWLSTCYREEELDCEGAKFAGHEYFLHNSVSPVYFHEAVQKMPKDALIIEIGPHSLFASMVRKTLGSDTSAITMMKRDQADSVGLCLAAIGKCYLSGIDVQPLNLHPPPSFPVASDVPFISPVMAKSWDHSQDFRIPLHTDFIDTNKSNECIVSLASGSEFECVNDYQVGEEIHFPVSGFAQLAWKAYAKQLSTELSSLPVKIHGAKFNRSVPIKEKGEISFNVNIFGTSGYFEITHGNDVVAEGNIEKATPEDISSLHGYDLVENETTIQLDGNKPALNKTEISTLQRIKGYRRSGAFEGITRASSDCTQFIIEWNNQWIPYLDCLIQTCDISRKANEMAKVVSFDMVIDPRRIASNGDTKYAKVNVNESSPSAETCGVKVSKVKFIDVCRKPLKTGQNNEQRFFPFCENSKSTLSSEVAEYEHLCRILSTRLLNVVKGAKPKQTYLQNGQDRSPTMNGKSQTETSPERRGLATMLDAVCKSKEEIVSDDQKIPESDSLKDDLLLTNLCSLEIMKSCLDLVADNSTDSTINVFGLGDHCDSDSILIKSFTNQEPCSEYTYTASQGSAQTTHMKVMHTINWNLGETPLPSERYSLVIASNILHMQTDIDKSLEQMSALLNPEGFLMIREITQASPICDALNILKTKFNSLVGNGKYKSSEDWNIMFSKHRLEIIMEKTDKLSTMFLLRKQQIPTKDPIIIYVDDLKCSWVEKIKSVLPQRDGSNAGNKIWLVSTDHINGVVGMVKCLRKERLQANIRCVLISNLKSNSTVPNLSRDGPVFKKLQAQDLIINMDRDGSWGSLYRLPIEYEQKIEKCHHACLSQSRWGDMSTLAWVSDQLGPDKDKKDTMTTYCLGLNPCDVKFVVGELSARDLGLAHNTLGFEASGRLNNGKRVMTLSPSACRTVMSTANTICLDVPETWRMDEAATVPLAYSTAVYALVIKAHARKGDRVLIHTAASHIGQAVYHIAANIGCEAFIVVQTQKQKTELMSRLRGIDDSHIALDSETNLEEKFKKDMDIVVSIKSGYLVHDLLGMVAAYGKFVEVETLANGHQVKADLSSLQRGVTYHRVNVYKLLQDSSSPAMTLKGEIQHHLVNLIKAQAVKPLPRSSFGSDDVMDALEYMQDNEDGNKVVIKLQADNPKLSNGPKESTVMAQSRALFKPSHSYVIMGGLGGFGLELAKWMVSRGCRKLVISSRSGLKTGLQHYTVDYLRQQGAQVWISRNNAVNPEEADALLKEASDFGPLGGIFNLSLVLLDKTMKKQTTELFNAVSDPKIQATKNFDQLTREKYKDTLHMFVVFSTISSAHGCLGQSNYGFANSCLERICEKRRHDNLPGLAIQWGIIGDVGVIARTTEKLVGFVELFRQQSIASCLKDLDTLLLQPAPVVSSFLMANADNEEEDAEELKESVLEAVGNLIGLRNTDTIDDSVVLKDLGMDSFTTAEVKTLLRDDFNVSLTDDEVRSLSVKTLRDLAL